MHVVREMGQAAHLCIRRLRLRWACPRDKPVDRFYTELRYLPHSRRVRTGCAAASKVAVHIGRAEVSPGLDLQPRPSPLENARPDSIRSITIYWYAERLDRKRSREL